jgi:hypothetical protein
MKLSERSPGNEVVHMNDCNIDSKLFSDDISNDYKCMICDRIPLHPCDLPCAHIGCITCLRTSLSSNGNNKCVICHQSVDISSISSLRVNAYITKQMSSLTLTCPHAGCIERITLGREGIILKEHMKK